MALFHKHLFDIVIGEREEGSKEKESSSTENISLHYYNIPLQLLWS